MKESSNGRELCALQACFEGREVKRMKKREMGKKKETEQKKSGKLNKKKVK